MRLYKLYASPRRFKWLLAEATVRLAAATVLRSLPLPGRAQFLMRGHRVPLHPRRPIPSCEEICRAVDIAGLFVPGTKCLVRAHVGCTMLNRFGYASEIRIGVSKKSSDLAAHAWVECEGRVVMGKTANQFVEFPKMVSTAGVETSLEKPRLHFPSL
jgi:hypothetical protein